MMRNPFQLVCLFLLLAGSPAFAERQEVSVQGRAYLIDLPAHPSGAMILALHGGGGNPAQFARNSGLSQPAMAAGYAVIYPAGSGRGPLLTWNAGYCCAYAQRSRIDDMGFLDAVVADAAQRFGLDAHRLYLTGMSNGSMMAESYAVSRKGRVKAVAGISGTIDLARYPAAAVPLLHIHGTADTHVPYKGGNGSASIVDTDFTSVPAEIAAFEAAFGGLVQTERVINPSDDGMRVIEDDYSRSGVAQIRLLTIEGGGHTWPGAHRSTRQGGTLDISANTEVLRFFREHP